MVRQIARKTATLLRHILAEFESEKLDTSDESAKKSLARLHSIHPDPMSSAIRDDNHLSLERPAYDLDIIIPVYKVEKYLRQCLDSILSQKTKYKIRALCVDDGSPDNCSKILDEYSSKDERCV